MLTLLHEVDLKPHGRQLCMYLLQGILRERTSEPFLSIEIIIMHAYLSTRTYSFKNSYTYHKTLETVWNHLLLELRSQLKLENQKA